MADTSRDTFRLTNVLHQLLDDQPVAEPRQYVDVRLQQGVPLLDADWNEAHEVRRREVELLIRDHIGDGVAGLGNGFSIAPVEADNDFAILAGALVVGGWQVINPALVRYSELADAPALSEPGSDRIDFVYLDAWEAEVGASGAGADERLVHAAIGIETAVRVERRWTVRVAEATSDFDALVLDEPGHKYTPLARLFRGASPSIEGYMIEDRRRLGLTLADGIKAPLFVRRGGETVNPTRFSSVLSELQRILRTWQENSLFPISIGTMEQLFAYQNALNAIYYLSTSAQVASDAANLDNSDALDVIQKLVDAQRSLIEVLRVHGTGVPEEMQILDFYETHLDGDAGAGLPGIQPPLDVEDLLGAVQGQETLNEMLGLQTDDLPEGNLTVNLNRVDPATPLAPDTPFAITYDVTNDLLIPGIPEQIDLEPVVSDTRWAHALDVAALTLDPGASGQAVLTVTPGATLDPGDFADINLVARAHRRPSLRSVQPAQRFTIDSPPPGESFFFYSGSVPLVDGELQLPSIAVEGPSFFDVPFTLVNTTGGVEEHAFRIEFLAVWPGTLPSGVNPDDWQPPPSLQTIAEVAVPGADDTVLIRLQGPSPLADGGVTEIRFDLQVTATLIRFGTTPVPDGKTSTVDMPVLITIS